jgi:hypothetical protein
MDFQRSPLLLAEKSVEQFMWQPSNLLRSAFSQNARPIKITKVVTSLAKELSFTISPHAYNRLRRD